MKIKTFLYEYTTLIYLLVVFITVICKYKDLYFVSEVVRIIFYVFYLVISFLGIYSLFKIQKNYVFIGVLFILPFLFVFLIPKWILIIPLIALLILLLIKDLQELGFLFFLEYSFLIIIILIGIWFNSFDDFSKSTIIKETLSPNNQYKLIEVEHDEGALGGGISIIVEKVEDKTKEPIYWGIIKKKLKIKKTVKTLYTGEWGNNFEIEWVNNESVKINNELRNINNDGEWRTYFINNDIN